MRKLGAHMALSQSLLPLRPPLGLFPSAKSCFFPSEGPSLFLYTVLEGHGIMLKDMERWVRKGVVLLTYLIVLLNTSNLLSVN